MVLQTSVGSLFFTWHLLYPRKTENLSVILIGLGLVSFRVLLHIFMLMYSLYVPVSCMPACLMLSTCCLSFSIFPSFCLYPSPLSTFSLSLPEFHLLIHVVFSFPLSLSLILVAFGISQSPVSCFFLILELGRALFVVMPVKDGIREGGQTRT